MATSRLLVILLGILRSGILYIRMHHYAKIESLLTHLILGIYGESHSTIQLCAKQPKSDSNPATFGSWAFAPPRGTMHHND